MITEESMQNSQIFFTNITTLARFYGWSRISEEKQADSECWFPSFFSCFFFVFQHNIKKQYIFYPLLSLDCMLCTIACLGSDDHLLIPRPSEEQRGGHRQIRMLQNNLSSPQGRRRNPKYIYKKGRRLDRGRHSCARWLHVTQWVMIKWSAKSFEYQA